MTTKKQKQARINQIYEQHAANDIMIARLRADVAFLRAQVSKKESDIESLYYTNTKLSHEAAALERKD